MICWIALAVLTLFTAAFLAFRNKQQEKKRVSLGKPAKVIDTSLNLFKEKAKATGAPGEVEAVAANEKAFDDLTDRQNEDFIYVL